MLMANVTSIKKHIVQKMCNYQYRTYLSADSQIKHKISWDQTSPEEMTLRKDSHLVEQNMCVYEAIVAG